MATSSTSFSIRTSQPLLLSLSLLLSFYVRQTRFRRVMDNYLVGGKQLPPGFRFHPTDEELCMYYLKRKVLGKSLGFELISELDVYKFSPWDLPNMVCYKSSDLDCYFYCPRGKKYPSGRTNRATECGYWKATGKDRPVEYKNRGVGKIKTLVFHVGKAPKGERTDWVMHEYRLEDGMLADMGVAQDAYVISKVFKKSGIGPKNWEQRVAPFVEEEWDCFDDPAGVNGSVLNARLVSEPAVTVDYEHLTVAGSNAGLVSQPAETGTSALYSGSLLTGTGSVCYENLTAAGSTLSNAGLVSQPAVTGTENAVYSAGSLFTDEHFVQSVGNVNPGLVSQPEVTGTSALYSANLFTDQHPVHSVFNTNAGLVSEPAETQPPVNTNPVGDPQAFSFGIDGEEDEIDRLLKLLGEGDFEGLDDQVKGDDIFSGLGDLDYGFLELNDFEEP